MKAFFKNILTVFLFSSIVQGYSQSLTVDDENLVTAGVQTDLNLGPADFSANRAPAVDVHNNSGVVVYVYTSSDGGGSANKNVYCVIYDKNWNVLTPEFRVNFNTAGDQSGPIVKINQNDNTFMVAWSSNHGADGDYDVYAKKINLYIANPTDVTNVNENSNKINTSTIGKQLLINICFDYIQNEAILCWRDYNGNDGSGLGAYGGRVYYPDFTVTGTDFLINQTTTNNQIPYGIEVSSVTQQLIALYTSVPSSGASDVYIRKFTRTGSGIFTGTSETKVSSTTVVNHWNPFMALNRTSGAYSIIWNADGQYNPGRSIAYRVFDKNGTQLKAESNGSLTTTCNVYGAQTMWDESTGYLIHFYFYNDCGSTETIKYQIINSSYAFSGTEQTAVATNVNNFTGAFNIMYSQKFKKNYLAYQVYSGSNSNGFARTFVYANASIPPPISACKTDSSMIWEQTTAYDEYGNITAETRTYYDKLNRPTQVQVRNVAANNIIVTATLYDKYGREAIKTLPAPINQACFTYTANFIKDTLGHAYTYSYFDNQVKAGTPGTLGYYYSNNNTAEPYVASTHYPYSRISQSDTSFGGATSTSQPGDSSKIGNNKEYKTTLLTVGNEMNNYMAVRNHYVPTAVTSCACQGSKVLTVDENGNEAVHFMDKNGHTLSNVTSDPTNPTIDSVTVKPQYYNYDFNLNLYQNVPFNLKVSGTDSIWVYFYYPVTSTTLLAYSGMPSGFSGPYPTFSGSGLPLQIRSKSDFTVYFTAAHRFSTVNIQFRMKASLTGNSAMFYLKSKTNFRLNLSNSYSGFMIKVTNINNGQVVYTGLASSFTATPLTVKNSYKVEITNWYVANSVDANNFIQGSNYSISVVYYNDFTDHNYNIFDDNGKLLTTVASKGVNLASSSTPNFASSSSVSTIGTKLSQFDPDTKLMVSVYRKDGKIRFSQNSKQKVSNKFSYVNYDRYGRTVEIGEYDPALDGGTPKVFEAQTFTPVANSVMYILESTVVGGGLGATACSCRTNSKQIVYSTSDPAIPVARTQRFLQGQISKRYNVNSAIWYSYDELGRIEWLVKSVFNFGGTGITKTITIDYTYDMTGNVLDIIYQKGTSAERFEHKYSYDINKRIIALQTKPGTGPYQNEAKYYYYLHGPLKRKELADTLQGIDYTYTVEGIIKTINHASLDNTKDPGKDGNASSANKSFGRDVFGMQVQYYDGDYVRSNSQIVNTNLTGYQNYYNGVIKGIKWQTRGQSISGNMPMYAFTYDNNYQLTGAFFGTVAPASEATSFTASNNFKVYNLTYDKNGNILTKTTNDNAGGTYNDFTYEYDPSGKTNKLNDVKLTGTSNYYATYEYDSIGQMNHQHNAAGDSYLDYDVYKRVTAIYSDAAKTIKKVTFLYDEGGHRLNKVSYNSSGAYLYTTWYIHDHAGALVSIYDDNNVGAVLNQTQIPVYSMNRIGVAYKSGTTYNYEYELSDHIGNVRAVIARTRTGVDPTLLAWTDFYPFGAKMPGRSAVNSPEYRNGFQGGYAEKDNETGWNSFEARMYDPEIGRWLTPDPNNQSLSPYSYAGNNPINSVDPDGRKFSLKKLLGDVVKVAAAVVVGVVAVVVGAVVTVGSLGSAVNVGAGFVGAGIGGALNVIGNLGHIDKNAKGETSSVWKQIGKEAEYFGAGAVGGAITGATFGAAAVAGVAAAGAANLAVDASNGFDKNKNGGFSVGKGILSFVNGGSSALGIGELAEGVVKEVAVKGFDLVASQAAKDVVENNVKTDVIKAMDDALVDNVVTKAEYDAIDAASKGTVFTPIEEIFSKNSLHISEDAMKGIKSLGAGLSAVNDGIYPSADDGPYTFSHGLSDFFFGVIGGGVSENFPDVTKGGYLNDIIADQAGTLSGSLLESLIEPQNAGEVFEDMLLDIFTGSVLWKNKP